MPNEDKNIKTYNKYLILFIIMNLFIYLYFTFGTAFNLPYMTNLIKNGIIFSIFALVAFVLNGLIKSDYKAMLVFWRRKNVYPGCRIFIESYEEDNRIDKSVLIKKYGKLPVEPQAQNKLWYKIYKNHEFDPMIFESQKSFLASRDLTGLSFIFLIIYPILAVLFNITFHQFLIYIIILFLQFIVLSYASRNYGYRFASNVLAKESSS